MQAKTYLKQLKKLDRMIENKLIEKEQWKDIALGVVASGKTVEIEKDGKIELHNMEKVQSSGSQSKMADAVVRAVDIEAEIDRAVDRLVDTKREVIGVIEQLSATEYDLLHMVYVQYLTLKDVAAKYDRTESWANYIHGQALKNVQRIIDKMETVGN